MKYQGITGSHSLIGSHSLTDGHSPNNAARAAQGNPTIGRYFWTRLLLKHAGEGGEGEMEWTERLMSGETLGSRKK